MPTTIEIKDGDWSRLNGRKKPGDGFKDVVERVLDQLEEAEAQGFVAGRDGAGADPEPEQRDLQEDLAVDDVQEETDDDLEADVWAAIDALDLPGSGEKLEGRQETIHDLYQHLRMEGTSRKSEFLKVLESSPHGYQSAESAWSNLIKGKDSLQSLPGVSSPGEGEHTWRYER